MARRAKGEGGITRRNDGRWVASLQVAGKRRYFYGRTRAEAIAKLDELRKQAVLAGMLPDPRKHSVDELMRVWLDAKAATVRPSTIRNYQQAIDHYIIPVLGNRTLDEVPPPVLISLYAPFQRDGKHATAQRIHRLLSAAFAMAERWGWIGTNPCSRVDAPRYAAKRKAIWNKAELDRFLAGTLDSWLYPLWITLLGSGCRIGEMLAATWPDLDFGTGALSITKSVRVIDGQRITSTPKTDAGIRDITMPQNVIAVLRQHRATQAAQRLAMGDAWTAGDLIFSGPKGTPLSPNTVDDNLRRTCDRLGIPRTGVHALRHINASMMIQAKMPIPLVSARLGHATSQVTMSVYAHMIAGKDDAVAEAIGRALEIVNS